MTAMATRTGTRRRGRTSTAALDHGRSWSQTGAVYGVAALIALTIWEIVSFFSGQWVPSVVEVARSVGTVLTSSGTLAQAAATFKRVAVVTIASIFIGVSLGAAIGFSWRLRAFVRPVLVVGLAIPDLVYLIMAILVLGATEASGIVAMTIAIIPLVTNAVSNSVLDRDPGLDAMAKVYRFTPGDYAKHVVLEQLKPALAAAVKTAFAFSWKLIVLMEALTMPDGIGARIYEGFRYLRPEDMLAWALIFIVVMKVVEQVIILPMRSKKY